MDAWDWEEMFPAECQFLPDQSERPAASLADNGLLEDVIRHLRDGIRDIIGTQEIDSCRDIDLILFRPPGDRHALRSSEIQDRGRDGLRRLQYIDGSPPIRIDDLLKQDLLREIVKKNGFPDWIILHSDRVIVRIGREGRLKEIPPFPFS